MKFTQSAALFGALVVAPISHVTVSAFAPSTRISISASSASSALRMQQNNHNHNQKKTFTDSTSFFPFDKPQESEETNTSSSITSSSITSSTALYAKKSKGPNEKASDGSADVRQLLGLKGASESTDIWKIRLQLTKPVTWIPLLWGVMCGAAASGNYHWIWNPLDPTDRNVMLGLEDASKGLLAMILAGPFLTGYTQTINDWYDREIDAINEPYRPIPSGAISEKDVIAQIWVLLLGGLGISYGLDVWAGHDFPVVFALSVFGSFISYIYSAPPLKLKQNGWAGNYALGASYISLPWWCGQAVFGELDKPVFWVL
jgi:chlorophyll synthase